MGKNKCCTWLKYGLLAILSTFIFCMNLDNLSVQNYAVQRALWNLFGAFFNAEAAFSFLVPVLAFFYAYSDKILGKSIPKSVIIFSFFVSFLSVIGLSYSRIDSWDLIFSLENGQFIKAFLLIGAYTVFFSYIFRWILHLFTTFSSKPIVEPQNWYTRCLYHHTYITVFLTLLPLYLVLLVISYPAVPSTDSVSQIVQSFSGAPLANDHPICHTAFQNICIKAGIAIFHSANAGLLLISLSQLFLTMLAVSYAIDTMIHCLKLPLLIPLASLVYYAIHPMIQRYTFYLTKDVIYSAAYLSFILSFYLLLTGKQQKKDLFVLLTSGILFLLFRNEAKVISALCMLLVIITKISRRKYAAAILLATILVSSCMSFFVFPLLNISPGSAKETLSVPFQQTARYLRDYPADVTAEEKAAIEAVLDYDKIGSSYRAWISDPVKSTYNKDASLNDLLNYFKAWASMFLKHPDVYLEATINNYYQYYAFTDQKLAFKLSYDSWVNMDTISVALAPYGVGHPETLDRIRVEYENVLFLLFQLPFLSLLMMPAVYTWTIIALFVQGILRKNKAAFVAIVFPLVTQFLVMFGPCNGTYGRYQYPIILSLPVILAMYISAAREQAVS